MSYDYREAKCFGVTMILCGIKMAAKDLKRNIEKQIQVKIQKYVL